MRAWLGNTLEYNKLHKYLRDNFKKPESCDSCGLTNPARLEWANVTGKYDKNINNYKALCVPCHRKLDGYTHTKTHCKWGHEYTPENTKLMKRARSNYKRCLTCHKEWWQKNGIEQYKKNRLKYLLNREERIRNQKEYYHKNKEKILTQQKERHNKAFIKKRK